MPKSKLRGGKKAHNKRVKKRNVTISSNRKKMQDEYTKMMNETYEKFLAENPQFASGNTENSEEVEVSTDVNIDTNSPERGITITSEDKPVDISVDYKPTNPNQGLLK